MHLVKNTASLIIVGQLYIRDFCNYAYDYA